MLFFVVLCACAVVHNCALDGVNVVDIGDEWHAGPVVGKVSLPGGVALNENNRSQSAAFGGEAKSSDAGEKVNVGEFMAWIHAQCGRLRVWSLAG